MIGYVTDWRGERWRLPELESWEIEYTAGVPCDSFWLRFPWKQENETGPEKWVGFQGEQDGARAFTGVVDECERIRDGRGERMEMSGRGMAALLLDNEAMGQDYAAATLEDILRDHVEPYGIAAAPGARLPAVSRFSVAAGSSEWSVVYDFARYYGGVTPRFDKMGRLVLTGWLEERELILGDDVPVTEMRCTDRRYGVLSEVVVRDRYSGSVQTIRHHSFLEQGIRARRVIAAPGRSSYKAMRYSGQFQLDRAAVQRVKIEVQVALPFCAMPGELVVLERSGWDRNGRYRVIRAKTGLDETGYWTRLELARPDFVV